MNLIDGKHIGTGFVVADGILATNRHVLDDLTFGTGVLAADRAQVAFQREVGATDAPEQTVPIAGVIRVHPRFDIALLAIAALGRPPVTLDAGASADGARVAVIGYPAKDEARNPMFTAAIFGNTSGSSGPRSVRSSTEPRRRSSSTTARRSVATPAPRCSRSTPDGSSAFTDRPVHVP